MIRNKTKYKKGFTRTPNCTLRQGAVRKKRTMRNLVSGFTLIELMIATGIFAVVMLISAGALIFLSKASDRSNAILVALNNLDFATESMARTIRTGTNYFCTDGQHPLAPQEGRDCPWRDSKSAISFTDQNENRILYRLNRNEGALERINLSDIPHTAYSITSPEINIESLKFTVVGSDARDNRQPMVTIRIKGRTSLDSLKEEDQVDFDLQTTVTQLNVEI